MPDPGAVSLVFGSPRWLWLLALIPILAVPVLRTSAVRSLWIALGFRIAAAILVTFVVAGAALDRHEPADDLCVVVVTDHSESTGPEAVDARDRILDALVDRLRPGDHLGAVGFARRAEVVQWPVSPPLRAAFPDVALDPSGTRLGAGIEAAVPLCPEESVRKVVLVTDGNETEGDARRAAAFARQSEVRLYAVVPGPRAGGGLSFEKLVAPPLVREGSMFPLRVVVRNRSTAPISGELDLLLNGEAVSVQPIVLDPGVNLFEVPYQLHERGSYRLGARVGGEGGRETFKREVSLAVAGPIRALVVGESKDSALARALRLKDVDVEFVSPKDVPELEGLLPYHCVILDDTRRKSLSDSALATLESYVRNFGGGLVMTGGAGTFGDKEFRDSLVERALPVRLVEQEPPPRGRAPMGVFLLVDRSNSMSYNSRRRDVRDGEKMSYAKQAALALVAQLRPEDRVGVIAFDSDPYVLGPLRALSEHRKVLQDRIARLLPGGGTDFKASLEIAAAQLAASGVAVRHVILLTDGDTNRGAADHDALIEVLARTGISVTSIRIGTEDTGFALLQKISSATGGRFHYVRDVEQLPQLLVSDTSRLEGQNENRPTPPTRYSAKIGQSTQVVRGISEADLPALRHLVRSRLKPAADLVLFAADEGAKVPVLASWQYGLGRTAILALDPSAPDASSWAAWPGFGKLWSQLVRWVIREESPWETRHAVRFEEGQAILEVQTFDPAEEGVLIAQIFTTAESSVEVHLTPVAPRLYRASLPPLPPGRYAFLLTRRHGGASLAQKRDVLVLDAGAADEETAELARRVPDMELLTEITAETGGTVGPEVRDLVERSGAIRHVQQRIDVALIPLALMFLLGDIWIRRRLAR